MKNSQLNSRVPSFFITLFVLVFSSAALSENVMAFDIRMKCKNIDVYENGEIIRKPDISIFGISDNLSWGSDTYDLPDNFGFKNEDYSKLYWFSNVEEPMLIGLIQVNGLECPSEETAISWRNIKFSESVSLSWRAGDVFGCSQTGPNGTIYGTYQKTFLDLSVANREISLSGRRECDYD